MIGVIAPSMSYVLHLAGVLIDLAIALIAVHLLARHFDWDLLESVDRKVAGPVVRKIVELVRRQSRKVFGRAFTGRASILAAVFVLTVCRLLVGGLANLLSSVG